MNGHFSAVGEAPGAGSYEHGVQVIDEDKEFNISTLPMLLPLASITILSPSSAPSRPESRPS
ncbi:hypothetical protein LB505_000452 [Fusarium chuoi]|nr:hypothetical protein LB505_000452 [Fusarium chuoi]